MASPGADGWHVAGDGTSTPGTYRSPAGKPPRAEPLNQACPEMAWLARL